MWNDEDNNPYGSSFDRRDSFESSVAPSSPDSRECLYLLFVFVLQTWILIMSALDARYDTTSTDEEPDIISGYAKPSSDGDSDEEEAAQAHGELQPKRKPGGYDSRIEQILYENPETPILIVDAGKSLENSGRYIVYTIRTGVSTFFRCAEPNKKLSVSRILRFEDDTRNLPLCARL